MSSEKDAEFFKELQKRAIELKVLIDRPARNLDDECIFRAAVCKEEEVKNLFEEFKVEKYEEKPVVKASRRSLYDIEQTDFPLTDITERYLSWQEIYTFIDKIAELIKNSTSKIEVTINEEGLTYEKRPIKSITFEFKGKSNPIVVIDAGVHAREWHSRSLALFVISQLMEEAKKEEEGILFNTTFIIVPNVNPDGYDYSRKVVKKFTKIFREFYFTKL